MAGDCDGEKGDAGNYIDGVSKGLRRVAKHGLQIRASFGNTPPKWFWPSVGAAGAYEFYNNWPRPESLKTDKTNVAPPVIKSIPREN